MEAILLMVSVSPPSDGLCLAGVAVPPWPLCCTGQPAMLVLLQCWLLQHLDPWQQKLSIYLREHLPAQLGLCFKGGHLIEPCW